MKAYTHYNKGTGLAEDFADLKPEYIEHHKHMAVKELARMEDLGLRIHHTEMVSSGDFDGMKLIEAVVEYKDQLCKIKWHDSPRDDASNFFVKHESGGSSPINLHNILKDLNK